MTTRNVFKLPYRSYLKYVYIYTRIYIHIIKTFESTSLPVSSGIMSINGRLVYIIEILGFPLKPQPQNPFPSPIRASQPSGSVRRPAVGHWYGCCRESSMNQGSHGGGYSRSMDIIGYPICHLYLIRYYILLLLLYYDIIIIYYYYY